MAEIIQLGGEFLSTPTKSGQVRKLEVTDLGRPLDDTGGAVIVIDQAHHEVHAGDMFHAENLYIGVGNNGSADFVLLFGTVQAHTVFSMASGGNARVYLYEGPTYTGGSAVTVYNVNRTSAGTTPTTAVHTPSVTNVGTALVSRFNPGGNNPSSKVGGGTRSGIEWILAPSTPYMLRVTNVSGSSSDISISAEWYEE